MASNRENALDEEHDFAELISQERKFEATEEATKLIIPDSPSSSFDIKLCKWDQLNSTSK